jgi:hypothetical protein
MNAVEIEGLENPEVIPPYVRAEIPEAFDRAQKAGAKPPLEYVGAGMYGIVFCDHWGRAWKVARLGGLKGGPKEWSPKKSAHLQFILDGVTDEYEWLRAAANSGIARHAAEVYDIHPEELVLERECVDGRAGAWADDRRLHDLHRRIQEVMIPLGWTAPEFKENSYIIRPDNTPVIVDISMAMRVGRNLTGYVEDVLAGRRGTHEGWRDMAYSLLSEMRHGTVPQEVGRALIDRLNERDPEIKRGFAIPW